MITQGLVKDGEIKLWGLDKFEGQNVIIQVNQLKDKRTITQNDSLHLLFKQLSDEMVAKGIDFRSILSEDIYLPPTPEMIKMLWKKLQKALLNKRSTTQLNKVRDIDVVYDNLNLIIIERTRGEIRLPPFPSIENLTN